MGTGPFCCFGRPGALPAGGGSAMGGPAGGTAPAGVIPVGVIPVVLLVAPRRHWRTVPNVV